MQTFFTVLLAILCALIITLILLQPSKGGSFFTASNQGVFGSSGGTTFLFRATMWCAGLVAALCLILSRMRIEEAGESVVPLNATTPATTPVAPATPDPVTAPATTAPAPTTAPAK